MNAQITTNYAEKTATPEHVEVSRFLLALLITFITAFIGGDTLYVGIYIVIYLWGVVALAKIPKKEFEMYFIFAVLSCVCGFAGLVLGYIFSH